MPPSASAVAGRPLPRAAVPPRPPGRPAAARALRGDIQGLRAVAVLMVMLYHAGVPGFGGGFAGVDVFFVVSGFLITRLIARELERTGTLSVTAFWARRARRLLPAAAVVLVVVAVASVWVLPQPRWGTTSGDIVAAAAYVLNWRLASASVDYLAQDYAPSPVQHFWSLAVEEQFYLFWPLLVLALIAAGRRPAVRYGVSGRGVLLIGIGVVAAGSLVASVLAGDDPAAFFRTTTRGWELGIGAVVALCERRTRRLPPLPAAVLTWSGLAVLVAVTVTLPDTVPWPGSAALLPTLATAAIVAGGPPARVTGAAVLLDRPLLRAIGDRSYSLYLWHWPLLVLAEAAAGRDLGAGAGSLVVALSVGPALLTQRLVENPVRRSGRLAAAPRAALAVGAACTVVGVVAGLGLRAALPEVAAVPSARRPGAAALVADPATAVPGPVPRSISPDPLVARADLPDLYARGCESGYSGDDPEPCTFDPPGRAAGAARPVTVALVGDSRAAQWSPALQDVAARQRWRLVTITKAGCPLADVGIGKGAVGQKRRYSSCATWNGRVMRWLRDPANRPDLLVTTAFSPYASYRDGRPTRGDDNVRALVAGFHRTWSRLNDAGIPVVAIEETPLMSVDVVECVAGHRSDPQACGTPRATALAPPRVLRRAAVGLPASAAVDLTPTAICPAATCPAVIGNVLVYRDTHHLTAQYARTLAPFVSRALAGLRGQGFAGGRLDRLLPGG